MAERRIQMGDLRQQALNPQARPVDTFITPGGVDPSQGLQQLASSLEKFSPYLARYGQGVMKEHIEEAQLRAQRDRLKNQMDYAEATRQGIVPEGANPWYVRAYKELDGEIAGKQEYFNQVSQAWHESGLSTLDYETEAERNAAMADFLQQQREQFLADKEDLHWVKGFEKGRQQAESTLMQRHIQATMQANEEKAALANGKKINEILLMDGTPEERAEAIAAFGRANHGKFGQSFQSFNKQTVGAITSAANQLALARRWDEAYEMLGMLNKVPTRDGAYLGGTTEGREAFNATISRFQQMERADIQFQRSNESWEWQKKDQQWKTITRSRQWEEWAAEDSLVGVLREIAVNPVSDIQSVINDAIAQNPKLAKHAGALQNAWEARVRADRIVPEDKVEVAGLRTGIEKGTIGPDELLNRLSNDELSFDTFLNLMDDLARNNSVSGRIASLSRDHRDLISDYEKGAIALAQGELSAFGQPSVAGRDAGFQVQRVLKASINEYLSDNPSPKYTELQEFLEGRLAAMKKSGLLGAGIEGVKASAANYGTAQVAPLADLQTRVQQAENPQPQAPQQQQGQYPKPPQASIERLRTNPDLKTQFEEVYGPGSAEQYLNQ